MAPALMLEPSVLPIRSTRVRIVDSLRINPAIVRSYDIRGCVGRQLSLHDAHTLGLAYASVARSQHKRYIAVGRDGRLSSADLENELVGALVTGGMQVRRLGVGPTPQLYFALHTGALTAEFMLPGSLI